MRKFIIWMRQKMQVVLYHRILSSLLGSQRIAVFTVDGAAHVFMPGMLDPIIVPVGWRLAIEVSAVGNIAVPVKIEALRPWKP